MKAKFIEGEGLQLGLEFDAETDDERLLLRAFMAQTQAADLCLKIVGNREEGQGPRCALIKIFPMKCQR